MTGKLVRMGRRQRDPAERPTVLAIVGDSASGKTTLARGIVEALGEDRCVSVCLDDYHRFDRRERRRRGITPLHPAANYIDIMEQHLQLLAVGRPILKPVYDHSTGTFAAPEYVEPHEFVIIEGLLALSTPLVRACLDVSVFLEPDDELRTAWKIERDVAGRGYTREQVVAEIEARARDGRTYISPQRRYADIVVRFSSGASAAASPSAGLDAELLLRPTLRHPDFAGELRDTFNTAMTLEVIRDDGNPTDLLRLRGDALRSEYEQIEKRIWTSVNGPGDVPSCLGDIGGGRSSSLALTQLILLHHLIETGRFD